MKFTAGVMLGLLLCSAASADENRVSLPAAGSFGSVALCAGGLDKYHDYSLRIAYSLLEQADLSAGMRNVRRDFSSNSKADFGEGAIIVINIRI